MAKNALVIKGADFSTNKVTTVNIVEETPCTALTLSESSKTVTNMAPFTLTATKTPANTTDSLLWSSSDDTVATVSGGTVTIVGVGTAVITATCGQQTATCSIDASEIIADADFGFFTLSALNSVFLKSATAMSHLSIYDKDLYGVIRGFRVTDSKTGTPIPLPNNTGRIKVTATDLKSDVIHVFWCDTDQAGSSEYEHCCLLLNDDNSQSTASGSAVTKYYTKYSGANAVAVRMIMKASASSEDDPAAFASSHSVSLSFLPAET